MKPHLASQSRNRPRGFTLIELVVVILLISILAAVALPRFLNIKDNAEAALVTSLANSFSSGLVIAKSEWIIAGNSVGSPTSNDSLVVVDGVGFNVNQFGWLDNVTGGSLGLLDQTKEECQQVFDNILQSPPRSTTQTDEASRRKATIAVSVVDGNLSDICRYEYVVRPAEDPDNAEYYFDYELSTGRVTLTLPDEL